MLNFLDFWRDYEVENIIIGKQESALLYTESYSSDMI